MKRIKVLKYIFAALLLTAATACGGRQSGGDTDRSRRVYDTRHGASFAVDSTSDGRVVITTFSPWQGASGDTIAYSAAHAARRIVAMSSTHVAMLEALGAGETIVGVSGKGFITSPAVQARGESIVDVGYDGNVNYELLAAARPDLVLLYGVNGPSPVEARLRELGIGYMYVGDYLEQSPLAKLEWIVAIGAATGKLERAIAIADSTAREYETIRDEAARRIGGRRPTVVMNMPYNDNWFMPSASNYASMLVRDAGGTPVYDRDTGNTSAVVSMEEAVMMVSKADVWLNPGNARSIRDVVEAVPHAADAPAVASGRVYNNTARSTAGGGNDFFESGIVHPDIILRDLTRILNPDGARGELYYYKRLE